jgi:type I restriction enzyme S subunit
MSDIIETELGQIIKLGNGKIKPTQEGNIPIYGGNGVLGYCSKSNYTGNVIIIGRVGAYCGSVYYSKNPVWVSDNALAANPKGDNNSKYLYYLLKQLNLNNYAEGSSHPLVTQGLINAIEVKYHKDPVEQQAIAEVLSSIDDKIDLLHRNNKTLEEMAETLFRKWFDMSENTTLQFGYIGDYFKETIGGEWGKEKPDDQNNIEVICMRGTDIGNLILGIPNPPKRYISEKKATKCMLQPGDVIIEISGGTEDQSTGRARYFDIGTLNMLGNKVVFSNFCRLLRPTNSELYPYLYLLLKHLYDRGDFFNLENGTSGIKNLALKAFLFEERYPLGSTENALRFSKTVAPLFNKTAENRTQIIKLSEIRDTLLPKLMSGQVRVNN